MDGNFNSSVIVSTMTDSEKVTTVRSCMRDKASFTFLISSLNDSHHKKHNVELFNNQRTAGRLAFG
jgi:hypothetical protein